jgi:hypothetical protein
LLGSINPPYNPGRAVRERAAMPIRIRDLRCAWDGVTTVEGGTSAVAPLWAGLFGRLNSGLGGSSDLGDPAPATRV